MNLKDTSQVLFYVAGVALSIFSIYSIYQARRQYRRSLRQRTAESLMELEQRFTEFKDILPLIDPESQRYQTELEPTVNKSLQRVPQGERLPRDRKLILRLDQFLRFVLLLTSLEKYDLVKDEALQYMYLYWFNSLKQNPHLKLYIDNYFPTLAAALEANAFSPSESRNFFIKESFIKADAHDVFKFHEEPAILAKLTPPSMLGKVVKQAKISQLGDETVIKVKLFRLFRVKWVAQHEEYRPPFLFTDVQVRGPFRYWRHRHIFRPVADGAVLRDEIVYETWPRRVGRAQIRWLIERRLRKFFDYRHQITREFCERTKSEPKSLLKQ